MCKSDCFAGSNPNKAGPPMAAMVKSPISPPPIIREAGKPGLSLVVPEAIIISVW
ncbi:hypothetical protein NBRC116597_02590 [Phaeobacter sp. NW0010-22]